MVEIGIKHEGQKCCNLVSLIRAAKRIFNISDNFNEKVPGVIARGIRFLQDKVGIDTSHYQSYIETADDLRMVRNCITHSEGNLNCREAEDVEAIEKYMARNSKIVEVDQRCYLTLHADFIETTTSEMLTLLDLLNESVGKKCRP